MARRKQDRVLDETEQTEQIEQPKRRARKNRATPPPPPLDETTSEALARVASQLGEDGSRVVVRHVDWNQFLSDGVIVTPHFHRWRAVAQLDLEHLGIQPETKEERTALLRTLNLGSRNLLPPEILDRSQRVTDAIRHHLEKHSFKTHWGRYIHTSRYDAWKQRNDELKAEYLAIGQEIEDTWDDLMRQVTVDYASVALQTYNRLLNSAPVRNGSVELPDLETFVADFQQRRLAQTPTPQQARGSYAYVYDVEMVPLVRQLEAERAQGEAEVAKRVERARLEAQSEMARDLAETERRNIAEGLDRFVTDLKAQIRGSVYDVAVKALEAIQQGKGKLPGNSTRGLRSLVGMVKEMMFWDDEELTARLAQLDSLASQDAKNRDDGALTDLLLQLGAESRLVLLELDRPPARSAQDVGIPDDAIALGDLVQTKRSRVEQSALENALNLTDVEEIAQPARRSRRGVADEILNAIA